MKNLNDIKEGLALFEKHFQLDASYLDLQSKESFRYDEAYILIMRVVEELLVKDFNRLINCLYILDVSEVKLKSALAESNENPASIIAEMIIERELQKVETRKKYKP